MFASLLLAAPTQSFAAKLKVSTKVKAVASSGSTGKVVVTTKASKRAKVKVKVTKNGKTIKTIKPKGTYYKKTTTWNLKNSKGKKVAAGTYKIKVYATRNGKTVTTSKTVKVKRKAPAPTPVTAPAPAPVVKTPDPVADPEPTEPEVPVVPVVNQTARDRWVGFYVPGVPQSMGALTTVEQATGSDAAVVNFFISDSESFPTPRCNNVRNAGAVPLVTLEFWSTQNGGLSSITNGNKDAYLRNFADAAKAYGGEVWLRPFHEMNGDWYPWAGTASGNSPEKLTAAWKHVYNIFQARGATNVKFVWCVNNDNVPNTSVNQIPNYWPGDAYVDMVALDGYNWGTGYTWSKWRSFGAAFDQSYKAVAKLTNKPMFVAETATSELGGSKAAWITDMFNTINSTYTRIEGVVWFEVNKEQDWRVMATSSSINAFKQAMATGY